MSLKSFSVPLLVICLLSTCHVLGSSDRFLLYSKSSTNFWGKSKIFKLPINSAGLSSGQQTLVKSISYTFEAISYDPTAKRMYWADDTYFDSEIRSVSLDGSDEKTVVTNLETIVALAVDIAGRNLYWADSTRDRIEVARLDGSYRKKLLDVPSPTSMVLDLKAREIYWSSYEFRQVKIEKASMDGSSRSVILSSSSRKKPTGLSIDTKNQILYWAERRKQEIYYIKLTTPNTVNSITTTSYKPFRLSNIGKRIYWTERGNYWGANGKIGSLNTTSKSDIKILVNVNLPEQIYAYDPDQPYYGNTTCGANKGGCEHLCLQTPEKDKCVCTAGMILSYNGKSCHFREFVLVADDSRKKIFRKSLDDLSHPRTALPLGDTGHIKTVDYDPLDKKVYWTDSKARISRAFLNGSSIEKIIDSHNLNPSGHAIDVIGRNIYWYDKNALAIGVSKLDGRYPKTLVKLNNAPMAISLGSKQGYVYWAHSSRRKITIKRSQMNGTNEENVVSEWKAVYRVNYVWLAHDSETNRLYFHSDHDIWYTDTKLLNDVVHTLNLAYSRVSHTSGLAVKESYLYWGNLYDAKVYRVNKTSLKSVKNVMSLISPMDLHVFHNYTDTPDDFHPCAQDNGWCTHLCLINPSGYSCLCPTNTGPRKCYTTPVVPSISRSRPHPPSTSTMVVLASSPSPVGSSVRAVVIASSSLHVSLSRREISSAHRSSSSHVSSSNPRISTVQLRPSSYSISSSNLNRLSTSFPLVMPYSSYLFSPSHAMSSSKFLPSFLPHFSSIKSSASSKYSKISSIFLSAVQQVSSFQTSVSSTYSRFSSPSNAMPSIKHLSSMSKISSPIHEIYSPNVLSSHFTFSSRSLHSSVKAIALSSLHPVSSYWQTSSQSSPQLFPNPSSMFFSQVSSKMPLVSSSSVVLLASSPVLPTTTQLSPAHPTSSAIVSSTSSLVLTSHFLQSSISLSSLTSLVYHTTSSSLRPLTRQSSSFARVRTTSTIAIKASPTTTATPPLSTTAKPYSTTLRPKTTISISLLSPSRTTTATTKPSSTTELASSSASLSKISSKTKIRIPTSSMTTASTKSPSAATKASPSSLLRVSSTTKIRTSSLLTIMLTIKSSSAATKASPSSFLRVSSTSKIRTSSSLVTTILTTKLSSAATKAFSLLKTSSTTSTMPSKSSPASTQRPSVTSTPSVPPSSRQNPALPTTEVTSSSLPTQPTCPPLYYGVNCGLFIGENKMSLTLKRDGEKLSVETFKRSVSKGITEYCLKDSCNGLLSSFKKSRRDTKTTTKFTTSDVIVLSDPTIFSAGDEVATIQFAIINPLAQDSSVITRSVLCKLVSNAKDFIQGLLQGPKITKIDPECGSIGGKPSAGQQKGGDGTPSSVTISLSVLFVILLILVVIYFVVRYMRKKASSKRQSNKNRNEFSFQNVGYLQDESALDTTQPTFITPSYDNNQNFNDMTTKKSTSGRQTAWDDIPNGLPTSSSPHQVDDLEIDDYDHLQVTTPFPPSQDIEGRPFRYERLNPNTSLNHDYQALSPRGGMNSRRENEYAEVDLSSIGNPLYESAAPRIHGTVSTDNPLYDTGAAGRPRNIRDNGKIATRNSPRHLYGTPQRLNFFENSEITFIDNPRQVNATPNRSKKSYGNDDIVRIDDVHVDATPKRSRNTYENDEMVRIDDVHVDATPGTSSNAIYENNKSNTPSNPTDDHIYDHLERFQSLTNNNRDGTDYDHLCRDRPVGEMEGQRKSQSSNEMPVLQIDGPDDREETII